MLGLESLLQVGNVTLKNRIVMPPMVTDLAAEDGTVTSELISHYEKRAAGGVGLVIIEASIINPEGRITPNQIGIYDGKFVRGLSQLSGVIRHHGAAVMVQLHHAGPKAVGVKSVVSASSVPVIETIPGEMSQALIEKTIEEFVAGAFTAKKAGFQGVELHGAHFYLLNSFLSPLTNKRNDSFGDALENRVRIVKDIILGIKEYCGSEFLVGVRLNGEEPPGGLQPKDTATIAVQLEKSGADLFHISGYNIRLAHGSSTVYLSDFTSSPQKITDKAVFLGPAEIIKSKVKTPVIGVGKLGDYETANTAVSANKVDLVAVGRPLIADASWANKVLGKHDDPIHECTYCNGCRRKRANNKPVSCIVHKYRD